MPKQFISQWLIDMLDSGPYKDDREVQAEQQKIRANAKDEVDKIWTAAQKKLAPPEPVAPLPPPDWGTPAPPAPSVSTSPAPSTSGGNPPNAETQPGDPGIGVVSRLADPMPPPPVPAPPAIQTPDYWSSAPSAPRSI